MASSPAAPPVCASRPLLLTRSADLADRAHRLAAAAGVDLDQVDLDRDGGPQAALQGWSAAPAVLVGPDQLGALASLAPPRRAGVVVVAPHDLTTADLTWAVECGAQAVRVLPADEEGLMALLADLGAPGVRSRVGRTVAVVGGAGGVGASVLAAALAHRAARSGPALLADLDPAGPDARRLLGLEEVPGLGWGDLADTRGRLGAEELRQALPRHDDLAVLAPGAGDRALPSPPVLRQVLDAGRRGHDLVVLDLPRAGLTAPGALAELGGCDDVLLVVRPTVCGLASAVGVRAALGDLGVTRAGVVVRARRHSPSAPGAAQALGLPLLGELPDQRHLDEDLDLGLGPCGRRGGALARCADQLLEALAASGTRR